MNSQVLACCLPLSFLVIFRSKVCLLFIRLDLQDQPRVFTAHYAVYIMRCLYFISFPNRYPFHVRRCSYIRHEHEQSCIFTACSCVSFEVARIIGVLLYAHCVLVYMINEFSSSKPCKVSASKCLIVLIVWPLMIEGSVYVVYIDLMQSLG